MYDYPSGKHKVKNENISKAQKLSTKSSSSKQTLVHSKKPIIHKYLHEELDDKKSLAWKKNSTYWLLNQINNNIKIPQLNLREMRANSLEKHAKTMHTARLRHTMAGHKSNIDLLKSKELPRQPTELFLKWKSELEFHTELRP
jgi:hypothetical protein